MTSGLVTQGLVVLDGIGASSQPPLAVETTDTIEIDARPSDAIALALRTKATVLCDAKVLEEAHMRQEQASSAAESDESQGEGAAPSAEAATSANAAAGEEEAERESPQPIVEDGRSALEILESLDPKAFGKYKM